MHRPGQRGAHENAQEAGKIAELGGQHGADQADRARDCREMVAEQHPFIGRVVIGTICSRSAGVVFLPVKSSTLPDGQSGRRGHRQRASGDDHPQGIDLFGRMDQPHRLRRSPMRRSARAVSIQYSSSASLSPVFLHGFIEIESYENTLLILNYALLNLLIFILNFPLHRIRNVLTVNTLHIC